MKKNKQVKVYSLGGIILLLVLVAVIAALVITGAVKLPKDCNGDKTSVSKAYNAQSGGIFDGIDVSTTEESYYYLDIPLKGREFYIVEKDYVTSIGGSAWVRTVCPVTLIIRFEQAKHGEKNILVTAHNVSISVPSALSTSHKVIFQEDFYVNIRESYYNELKAQESFLSSVQISIYYDGYSAPISTDYFVIKPHLTVSGISVNEEEQLRPGDDGFGDDGGLTSGVKTFWDYLMEWYNSLSVWGKVLVWVGIAVVILGIISLFTGLFVRK